MQDGGPERDDDGFTLTEVLVGMVVMGLLMAVLSAAIIVVSKQSVVSSAALDAARTEQLIGMWLPTDLASNDDVFLTLPTASPCDGSCPTGTELAGSSNALLLSWTKHDYVGGDAVVVRTRVSYRYRPVNGSYELHRVECTIVGAASQTCRTNVAARGMQPPPSGVFDASIGPDWALRATKVTIAGGQDQYTEKQAIQVILRILESIPGRQATGEAKSVMFTVGSADRKQVTPETPDGDLVFGEPPSRCSGTIGVVVDTSNSIGGDRQKVRDGVADMINAFRGTPLRVQVVNFGGLSYTVSPPGTAWPHWWDMIDQAQVNALIGSDARGGLISKLTLTFGTNWEDALYRMFKNPDGTSQEVRPDKLIFFTDGEPFGHMAVSGWSSTGTPLPTERVDDPYLNTGSAPALSPRLNQNDSWRMIGFYRAARLLDEYDGRTKVVMVGVGPVITRNVPWIINDGGYHMSDGSKVFSPPYTAYARTNTAVLGEDVLRKLLEETGNPVVRPTKKPDGSYDTSVDATFYPVPDFAKMGDALRAVAIGQCGGTLTLQTRNEAALYEEEITYTSTLTTKEVTTNATKPNGTFDYTIEDSAGQDVVITPIPSPAASAMRPSEWTCISGNRSFVPRTIDIAGTAWDSVEVRVTPAAAISCTLQVVPA
ncbi:MAG: hypothetical protein RLZZ362_2111 [Actinomycetota bacterium]